MEDRNIIELFQSDLDRIQSRFARVMSEDLRESEAIRTDLKVLIEELDVHVQLLEETLYPALENALDPHSRSLLDPFREFTSQVRHLSLVLDSQDPSDSIFLQRLVELQEAFEDHADDLQARIFKRAEDILGSELDSMSDRYLTRRNEMLSSRHAA